MVLAICRCHLRDPQAAEDAAQETFLSAHRSLLGGTQPRDPAAWLATIARNECRRMWRTTQTAPLDDRTAVTALDPADIVADRADLTEVATAIAELPARQREALVLREFCGLSYEQVAAAMSVSAAAVESLLSRARRRLAEQFGDLPRGSALVVPATLREELARLIPGFDVGGAAAAGVATGAGGAATLTSLGSAPLATKVAATGTAVVAIAVPVQSTVRDDGRREASAQSRSAAQVAKPQSRARVDDLDRARPLIAPPRRPVAPERKRADQRRDHEGDRRDNSGPGSSDSGSGSSGSGPSGSGSVSDNSGPGSGSSGSGSSGSGSASSGSGLDDSVSGSGSSGSGSSGSGSGSSGSGSGSSGSGSDSSDTGLDSSGSGSSGSGSSGSGSGESGSGDSGSSGSGSGGDED
jgi:RNA polymerase sigma factor (sigma-70 family)